MRTNQLFFILGCTVAILSPWKEVGGCRRGRSSPPRCDCTPNIPSVNTNPYGLTSGRPNVCSEPQTFPVTECVSCSCGQCPQAGSRTYYFLQCCRGYRQVGDSCPEAIPCNQPQDIPNGDYTPRKYQYSVNERVNYFCSRSYEISNGQSDRSCSVGPSWTPTHDPACTPIPCSEPSLPEFSMVVGGARGRYPVNGAINVGCVGGYGQNGGGSQLICQLGPGWTGQPIICKPICFGQFGCYNGGFCQTPNFCANCNEGYASPKCDACPRIADCQLSICAWPDIQGSLQCKTCMYDYGPGRGQAYEVSPDKKSCLKRCSWRSDSNVCYPGTCGLLQTCRCAEGFESTQCSIINEKPRISPGFIRFKYGGSLSGQTSMVNITESLEAGGNAYSNAKCLTSVELKIDANYLKTPPERPGYVTSVILGLKYFRLDFDFQKGGAQRFPVITEQPNLLEPNGNLKRSHDVDTEKDLLTLWNGNGCIMLHGDKWVMTTQGENGGHIVIKNWETGVETKRQFQGQRNTRSLNIFYDYVNPVHCSKLGTCATQSLALENGFARAGVPFKAEWPGWNDDLAGIKLYRLEIIEMADDGQQLVEGHLSTHLFQHTVELDSAKTSTQVDLPQDRTSVYEFKLSVCDRVIELMQNCEHTRRFILVDNGTAIVILQDKPLQVAGSVVTNSYIWIRTLADVEQHLSLTWPGRYANQVHERKGLLKKVKPWPETQEDPFYDHLTGPRSIDAIPNIHGLIKTEAQFAKDHNGGSGVLNPDPAAWSPVADIMTESQNFSIARQDADSIRIWIRSTDTTGTQTTDSILFHVDSTPPIVDNITLVVDGRKDVQVHQAVELYKMVVNWISYDQHSGLHRVKWDLFDNYTRTELLMGESNLPNLNYRTLSECRVAHALEEGCYCTPVTGCYYPYFTINPTRDSTLLPDKHLATHDYDLYFRVVVENSAQLITTKIFKISIDTTGPHPGTVHIGTPGQPDIGFQSSLQLAGYWDGFIDKDSGIRFYKYKFDTRCMQPSDFSLNVTEDEVTIPAASYTAPGPGRYYLTVVAYNNGLLPSAPVCSSEVVIDDTAPMLLSINIDRLRTKPGLVSEQGGSVVWYVTTDQRRHRVAPAENTTAALRCLAASANVSAAELADFPFYTLPHKTINDRPMTAVECDKVGPFGFQSVLTRENLMMIDFIGFDNESNIADFFVGLDTRRNKVELVDQPDIFQWQSTGQQNHVKVNAPLRSGTRFYLHIVAVNRAGLTTSRTVGPITVDVVGPRLGGQNLINWELLSEEKLLIRIIQPIFVDPEDPYPIQQTIAIGTSPKRADVRAFSEVPFNFQDSTLKCSGPPSYGCAMFSLGKHEIQEEKTYYIRVRGTDTGGNIGEAVQEFARRSTWFGTAGVAKVVRSANVTGEEASVYDDLRLQSDAQVVRVAWYGFHARGAILAYRVAIANETWNSSVEVSNLTAHYTFTELNLEYYQNYAVSVQAKTEDGDLEAKTAPLTVIPSGFTYPDVQVVDGAPCDQNYEGGTKTSLPICSQSLGFQTSLTSFTVRWKNPAVLKPQSYQQIATTEPMLAKIILRLIESSSQAVVSVDIVHPRADSPPNYQTYTFTDLNLIIGQQYKVQVRFCDNFGDICSANHVTQGLYIAPSPPVISGLAVSLDPPSKISYSFQVPVSPDVTGKDISAGFQWTISESWEEKTVQPWQILQTSNNDTHYWGTVQLDYNITWTRCLYFLLRGYLNNGLFSLVTAEVFNCSAISPRLLIPNIVIDAKGPVYLERNAAWTTRDIDYISSTSNLSAVWPTLRHGVYTWAVLINVPLDSNMAPKEVSSDLCGHPLMISCGLATDREYVNVANLTLQPGHRYHVCVHANATIKRFELFRERLPEVTTCSSGVTVDTEPPRQGRVMFGMNERQMYSVSLNSLVISWSGFIDIETSSWAVHHSGIAKYYVKLGTHSGAADILNYKAVGFVEHLFLTKLKLTNGKRYFATVKAEDHVGLATEVSSDPVLVDVQPPRVDKSIHITANLDAKSSQLQASWTGVFHDEESGIASYDWCLGTQPLTCNVLGSVATTLTALSVALPSEIRPNRYYLTVRAFDLAGHSSNSTSPSFVYDLQPVTVIRVRDGTGTEDINYQSTVRTLSANWDPVPRGPTSSPVIDHRVWVGSCAGCEDVLPLTSIGLKTEFTFKHLNLRSAVKYYTTVQACTALGFCSRPATSDGVLIDSTAPILGTVLDGDWTNDVEFTSESSSVSASLVGFVDAESGIEGITWCLGSRPTICDLSITYTYPIVGFFRQPLSYPLPIGVKIFVNVVVRNHAGLETNASSNGFIIDTTPPVLSSIRYVDVRKQQVSATTMELIWEVEDPESHIDDQYLSLTADTNSAHHTSEPIKIAGYKRSVKLANLDLRDGNNYTASLVSCNRARFCSKLATAPLLIDNTPPHVGMFSVGTNHAIQQSNLTFAWSERQIELSWTGFYDRHSGIAQYYVEVGSSYLERDLTGTVAISEQSRNGSQMVPIQVDRNITQDDILFINLMAENGVGLLSQRLHAAFVAGVDGELTLVRRCSATSCLGHCICAPLHGSCPTNASCIDSTQSSHHSSAYSVTLLDGKYTSEPCLLRANWTQQPGASSVAKRFEVSGGLNSESEPKGLFDLNTERVWFDSYNTDANEAVLNFTRGRCMQSNIPYKFFLRAWFDDNSYAVYTSSPIICQPKHPTIQQKRGASIIETEPGVKPPKDLNFVLASTDQLLLMWESKILDATIYRVAMGKSSKGSADLLNVTTVQGATELTVDVHGRLAVQEKYYSSVEGCNAAGLCSTTVSNGFLVDSTPPVQGLVRDSLNGLNKIDVQNLTTTVGAFWNGFWDPESFVREYSWCAGVTTEPNECSLHTQISVGLRTQIKVQLSRPLTHGTRIYSKVKASNCAGLNSPIAVSSGVLVDLTPPVLLSTCQNISTTSTLVNPELRTTAPSIRLSELPSRSWWLVPAASGNDMPGWSLYRDKSSSTPTALLNIFGNGSSDNFLLLRGAVGQNATTEQGTVYKLDIWFSDPQKSGNGFRTVNIQTGTSNHLLKFHEQLPTNPITAWNRKAVFFTATGSTTYIQIATVNNENSGLGIRGLSLTQCRQVAESVPESSEGLGDQGLHISLQLRSNQSVVHVAWTAEDLESGIADTMVALGTVRGGIQLQPYTRLGPHANVFYSRPLFLPHQTPIFVSLLVVNRAGLYRLYEKTRATYADNTGPEVKLNPPSECRFLRTAEGTTCIIRGSTSGTNIAIQLFASDQESGLSVCQLALGSKPNQADVVDFADVPLTPGDVLFNRTVQLIPRFDSGRRFYATARCQNMRIMMTEISSDFSILIDFDPPATKGAHVRLVSLSLTSHPRIDPFIPLADQLAISWDGFEDSSSISHYEFSIDGRNLIGNWSRLADAQQRLAQLSDLPLQSGQSYTLSVRAVSLAQLVSAPVQVEITPDNIQPQLTGTLPQIVWESANKLRTSWDSVFRHPVGQLTYEVSVGSAQGRGNILALFETTRTTMTLSEIDQTNNYTVHLKAVSQAGLFTAAVYTIRQGVILQA